MRIEVVDGQTLGESTAEEIAAVEAAYTSADAPHQPPVVPESLRLELVHGWDGRGSERIAVARDVAGRAVGWGHVDLSHWDNPSLASLAATVVPAARRQGFGTALMDELTDFCRARGRTNLVGHTWVGNPGERFLAERGFERGQLGVQRRLDLPALDWDRIDAIHREAAATAHGYELVRLVGPTPDDMLEPLVSVWSSINDAPLDDLAMDDDEFSVERLRAYDRALANRHITVYRLLARRRSDLAWAGHTIVCVDRLQPDRADQEDTTVVRAHRGHRLGLLLKTAMLDWLREAEPRVEVIDTWNAASNTHMIAVNDAIGCQEAARSYLWQRRTA